MDPFSTSSSLPDPVPSTLPQSQLTIRRDLHNFRANQKAYLAQRQETLIEQEEDGHEDINYTVGSHCKWVQKVNKFVKGIEESISCEVQLCQMDEQAIKDNISQLKSRT